MTKKLFIWKTILTILSIILNIVPMAIYTIKAIINADLTTEKITLSLTILLVLILSIISWINRIALRSQLWILLIGIYVSLEYIITPIIIIAVCQILDEIIITPLKRHYNARWMINKEIDRRAAG